MLTEKSCHLIAVSFQNSFYDVCKGSCKLLKLPKGNYYDCCVRKKWPPNLLVYTLRFSMDHYSNNGVDSMANIFLLSAALISEKCIHSTLDVLNAFPSLVNHLAFTGSYPFTFVERGTVRQYNDPAEGCHTIFTDFIHYVSGVKKKPATLGLNYSAIVKR